MIVWVVLGLLLLGNLVLMLFADGLENDVKQKALEDYVAELELWLMNRNYPEIQEQRIHNLFLLHDKRVKAGAIYTESLQRLLKDLKETLEVNFGEKLEEILGDAEWQTKA